MSKVIAIANQKGGVGKTSTAVNLGIGLVNEGKRVLLIDCDAQGNLTESLGFRDPDNMDITLSTVMQRIIEEKPVENGFGILHHEEGADLMPANIELSGMETALVNIMSRERVLKEYTDSVRKNYDRIILDCSPSLGMITINALAAADEVMIPVQSHFLPAKGLEQLLKTIYKVKRQINPHLKIGGVLLTMVDHRTNFAKEISALIRGTYGKNIRIFKTEIPLSIRAAEASAAGKSIYAYDKGGRVAEAYRDLTKEVTKFEKQRIKHGSDIIR